MVNKKVRWLSIVVAAGVSIASSLAVNCFADTKESQEKKVSLTTSIVDYVLTHSFREAKADERSSRKSVTSEKWSETPSEHEHEIGSDDSSYGEDEYHKSEEKSHKGGGFFNETKPRNHAKDRAGTHKLPSWCSSGKKSKAEMLLCDMMETHELLADLDTFVNVVAKDIRSASKNKRRIVNSMISAFIKSRDKKINKGMEARDVVRMYGEYIASYANRGLIRQESLLKKASKNVRSFLLEG